MIHVAHFAPLASDLATALLAAAETFLRGHGLALNRDDLALSRHDFTEIASDVLAYGAGVFPVELAEPAAIAA